MKVIVDEQIVNKKGIGWPIVLLLIFPFANWIGFFWLMFRPLRPRLHKVPDFMIGNNTRLGSEKLWGTILLALAGISFLVGISLDETYELLIVHAYIQSLLLFFSAVFVFMYNRMYLEYRNQLQSVLNALSPTVDPHCFVLTVDGLKFKYDYWIQDLRRNNIPFLEYRGDKEVEEKSTSSSWHVEWTCLGCGAPNAKDVQYGEKPACDYCQKAYSPKVSESKKGKEKGKEKEKEKEAQKIPESTTIIINIGVSDDK